MIRGTTPTISMKLPSNVPVSAITSAMVSIKQVGRKEKIDKNLSEMTFDAGENTLMVKLSQAETLSLFAQKTTDLQLKVKMSDGTVLATYPMPIAVVDVINEEVI